MGGREIYIVTGEPHILWVLQIVSAGISLAMIIYRYHTLTHPVGLIAIDCIAVTAVCSTFPATSL